MGDFLIYDASAGSGKTFTLVREYLKICLASSDANKFREILAITFTNKAAAEMKGRILTQLQLIANGEPTPMGDQLLEELGQTPGQLRDRAAACLRAILHRYGSFSVGTIDQFTHRLIRTFAPDLGISANFELQIDLDMALQEAVQMMLTRVGTDKDLTDYLLDFVRQQLQDEKSFYLDAELEKKAGLLFHERSLEAVKALRQLNMEQLAELRDRWKKEREQRAKTLRSVAEEAERLWERLGIDQSLLNRGFLPKYFAYFADEGRFADGLIPNDTIRKDIDSGQLYPKSKSNEAGIAQLEAATPEILQFFARVQAIRDEHIPPFILLSLLLQQVYAVGLLKEIGSAVDEWKEGRRTMLLAEFNQLISEELRKQPAPFLFERIGERYRHFFIDEFQDTSRLQWENLMPLIENALSQGGSCLIVGDGKQSIYRWRGGEVEQFLDLISGRDKSHVVSTPYGDQELYSRSSKRLETNRRSREEVVNFNNSLYTHLAGIYGRKDLGELYRSAGQQSGGKTGGWVELLCKAKGGEEDNRDFHLQALEERIRWSVEDGYAYGDLAVLVRSNDQAAAVVEFLKDREIPVISNEALGIERGSAVQALLGALRFYAYPERDDARFELLSYLHRRDSKMLGEAHEWLRALHKLSAYKCWQRLAQYYPELQPGLFPRLSLYELLEHWVEAFHLNGTEDAYLLFFLEEASAYVNQRSGGVSQFLHWWAENGGKRSIMVPDGGNAVQVYTIHKSKGLEFPVVILPFLNWEVENISRNTEWLDLEEGWGIDRFLVRLSTTAAKHAPENYAALVENELEKARLDEMNVLYVASTRAEDRLHLITQDGGNSRLWKKWLEAFVGELQEDGRASWGERSPKDKPGSPAPPRWAMHGFFSGHWAERLRVSYERPLDWGAAMPPEAETGTRTHLILQGLQGREPVAAALRQARHAGLLAAHEIPDWEKTLRSVTEHPALKELFERPALAERSILLPEGDSLRPDRLVPLENGWTIVDYKTGAVRPEHRLQVNGYASTLEAMGESVFARHLVYLTPDGVEVDSW